MKIKNKFTGLEHKMTISNVRIMDDLDILAGVQFEVETKYGKETIFEFTDATFGKTERIDSHIFSHETQKLHKLFPECEVFHNDDGLPVDEILDFVDNELEKLIYREEG